MSHEQESRKPALEATPATPIIAWEQPLERKPEPMGNNVISIDAYRRQGTLVDSEATVTVREFHSAQREEPVRLIMVSSGFGQKSAGNPYSVQSKAA
ncbi:hypothetical protein LOZ80_36320 [Paenibacillus sp. HWE-109]|uniref:hypothetical protein n=1 Tax=Paenibacillus sp. HWE-109 TaxID=1306526 RepID=UPI001EDCD235|nr:hypothetical protein [Paenibacillus sp. HWE-109]UKS26869.1 hypothetical protein LOZ80_36320 [Paenibacillus sp. HWE-109]